LKAYALIAIIVSAMCILLSIIIIMYISSDVNGFYFSISAVLVLIQIMELIGNIKIYNSID